MSFIDSSTAAAGSPLAGIGSPAGSPAGNPEPVDEPQEEDQDERLPLEREDNGTLKERLISQIDDVNLARYLGTDELRRIGQQVVQEFRIDNNSRAAWADKAEKAMKFTLQETEEKQFPWPRASNVIYPLMAQASINFAARTYPALIQNRNVVKGVVWGSDKGTPVMENGQPKMAPPAQPGAPPQPVWLLAPGEKQMRASRVGEHMSYQLLSEMPYWEPQTDQLLHQLPVIGGAIRKTFRDTVEGKNASLFVSLMNLVWDYNAPSFEQAPRHTEKLMKYPHEITELELAGTDNPDEEDGAWIHYDYGIAQGGEDVAFGFKRHTDVGDASDPDAPHLFLEQHRRLDLDGDGYPEPYVVTVHERTAYVVRIVARYDAKGVHCTEDGETVLRIAPFDHYTLIPFLPSIDGGSYPIGFGHLLRPLNEALNTVINQMIDAGTLQNAGAGFIGSGLGVPSGMLSIQVGKYIRVDTRGSNIKDNVLPLEFRGPSTVLFQLLGLLMSAGKELASIQDVLTGEAGIANAPPTTVLALIEQGMKIYTAIHKRVYRAFKAEFAKLFHLNRLYLTEPENYRVGDEERDIHPDDYRLGGGVEPIADPTMVTDMQRLGRAQLLLTLRQDPELNGREILNRLFTSANIDRPEDLFAPPNPMAPMLQQLAIAKAQAELGEIRSNEQKNSTQAFLNLALARKNATAQEEVQLSAQMEYFRLRIEAVNAQTRSAAVDHAFHDTRSRERAADLDRAADIAGQLLQAHLAGGGTMDNLPPHLQPGPSGTLPLAAAGPAPGPGTAPDVVGPSSPGTGNPNVPA